jgi:hypothetical protein
MSLMQQVIAIIAKRGPSTVDDLAPEFPDNTRKQVQQALHNASFYRLLDVTRGQGLGGGKGSKPSTFSIGAGPVRPRVRVRNGKVRVHVPKVQAPSIGRVSSVWELGSRA